jgi:hypothetical protein
MINRRRMLDQADSQYQVVRDTATALVFHPSQHHTRYTAFTQHSSHQTARSNQEATEVSPPTYIPASKYPLPMRPIQFMPTQDAKNAARVMTLRRNQPISSEIDPALLAANPLLPNLDTAKIAVVP